MCNFRFTGIVSAEDTFLSRLLSVYCLSGERKGTQRKLILKFNFNCLNKMYFPNPFFV